MNGRSMDTAEMAELHHVFVIAGFRARERRTRRWLHVAAVLFIFHVALISSVESASQHQNRNWFQNIVIPGTRRRGDGATSARSSRTDLEAANTENNNNFDRYTFGGKESTTAVAAAATNPSWPSFLSTLIPAAALPERIHDPARLVRYAVTCGRIGMAAYLGHALYKAATEIVQEISSHLGGNDTPAYSAREVQRLMEFCLESDRVSSKTLDTSLLRLARNLLWTGLPLQSSSPLATASSNNTNTQPSVESILLQLTRSEIQMLEQCLWVAPREVSSNAASWAHIVGLHSIKESLLQTLQMLLPNTESESPNHNQRRADFASLFSSGDTPHNPSSATRKIAGMLLYGPPGCGKTLLVKALATTARLPCLVVTPSALLSKYVGETNQRVRTLFALANKLGPCVLCLDELDGILRERHDQEHDVARELKTEFVQWWDGMLQGTSNTVSHRQKQQHPILVIGATNRPFDVDAALCGYCQEPLDRRCRQADQRKLERAGDKLLFRGTVG